LQALRQKRKPQWWWETRPNFPPQFEQRFCNLVMTLSSGFAGVSTPANFVASGYFNSISAVRLPATQRCAGGQVSTLHCREISAELTFRNKVNLARTLRTECAPTGSRGGRASPRVPSCIRRAGRRGRVLLGTGRLVIKTANSAWNILVRQRTASFAEGGNQCE
jgi:hypothetical protein